VNDARVYYEGDVFEEAGNDRMLVYDLTAWHRRAPARDLQRRHRLRSVVVRTDGVVVEDTAATQ
jgi:hypothetical protein